jgi:hypothetical protein
VVPLDIPALRALADVCFVGPWRAEDWRVDCQCEEDCGDDHEHATVTAPAEYPHDPESPQVIAQIDTIDGIITMLGLGQYAKPHAAFIAASRTAIPALCDEVEHLRAVVEAARVLHDAFLLIGHDTLATTMNQKWAALHGAFVTLDAGKAGSDG